ncbi:MAG TPA: hypothetical protein VK856_15575, partial [Anaerolineaceae bacterium]|nr:hypothetical protein [Anaerolineaceae bacterium]
MQKFFVWLLLLVLLAACESRNSNFEVLNDSVINNLSTQITATPFLPEDGLIIEEDPTIFFPDYLSNFSTLGSFSDFVIDTRQNELAVCKVIPGKKENIIGNLTFVIVKPFNSTLDNLTSVEVNRLLFENLNNSMVKEEIFVNLTTYDVLLANFENLSDRFRILSSAELIRSVYETDSAYGIVGFEELTPEWKVAKIEGISPLDYEFDENSYHLNITYYVECENNKGLEERIKNEFDYFSNRDSQKITSILLTGTTALTRATAHKMEQKGVIYPGENVKKW